MAPRRPWVWTKGSACKNVLFDCRGRAKSLLALQESRHEPELSAFFALRVIKVCTAYEEENEISEGAAPGLTGDGSVGTGGYEAEVTGETRITAVRSR